MFLLNRRQFNTVRLVGGIFLFSGLFALAFAKGLEHFFHMVPCELCLWERRPWRVLMAFGVLSLVVSPRFARWPVLMGLFCLIVSLGLSVLHIGVEEGFWASPLASCHVSVVKAANISDWLKNLPAAPVKPCDQPDYLLGFPLSVTMLSGLYSLGIFILSVFATFRVFKHVKDEGVRNGELRDGSV